MAASPTQLARRHRSFRHQFLAFLILPVLLLGCEEEREIRTTPVVVEPAAKSYFAVYGEYIATVRASKDVEVRARVSGFVEEIPFREGSLVAEGDLLYRVDDRPYRARVNRLTAEVRSAESNLRKSQRDLERIEPLYEQDAASRLDLDTALAALEIAEAMVAAKNAELQEAKLELTYTEVRSLSKGLVGESLVDVGALVGDGGASLLTTVKQVDPAFIEFQMSTLDYLNAEESRNSYGDRARADEEGSAVAGFVRITLPNDEPYDFQGDIDFTDPQVNPQTGTFAVRATVPNPDRQLLPGQYVSIRLQLDRIPEAILVPERALQIEQGGSFLMVLMADGVVERRFVTTGAARDGVVVIEKGLDVGERIIVEGFQKVQHGDRARPLTPTQYEERLSTFAQGIPAS